MSSKYKNYDKMSEILKKAIGKYGSPVDEIMYNEKNDMVKKWADENNIKTHAFSEEWDIYDKNAGPICVAQMIKNADKCIALWDGGSKGCRTFIEKCYESGKTPESYKVDVTAKVPTASDKKDAAAQASSNAVNDLGLNNVMPNDNTAAPSADAQQGGNDTSTSNDKSQGGDDSTNQQYDTQTDTPNVDLAGTPPQTVNVSSAPNTEKSNISNQQSTGDVSTVNNVSNTTNTNSSVSPQTQTTQNTQINMNSIPNESPQDSNTQNQIAQNGSIPKPPINIPSSTIEDIANKQSTKNP